MSGSKARLQAIDAGKNYQPPAQLSIPEGNPGEIFGQNVFSKAVYKVCRSSGELTTSPAEHEGRVRGRCASRPFIDCQHALAASVRP